MKLLRWFADHFVGTCLTLLVLLAGGSAFAAVTYDVTNEPQMNLADNLLPSATTLKIASRQRNGDNYVFRTLTGGVLRIRWGAFTEDVAFTGASYNADNTVSITGLTRDLCPHVTDRYTSCGTGRAWGKGAIVERNVDARLLNGKSDLAGANTFTASGAVRFSGSGSYQMPYFPSTAERDRQRPSPQPFEQACVTATGLCYAYIGGTWTAYGNTGVGNADTTTAGKVELATVADQIARTANGESGAAAVVQARHLTQSGAINNTYQAGRIPILNSSGALAASLGGLGTNAVSSGSVIIGQGAATVKSVAPGSANNVLISNGSSWTSGSAPVFCKPVFLSVTSSTATGASSTTAHMFDTNRYDIPANDLINGVMYRFTAAGSGTWVSGGINYRARLGTTDLLLSQITPAGAHEWVLRGEFSGTQAASASARVRGAMQAVIGDNNADSKVLVDYNAVSVATNDVLPFTVVGKYDASNAGHSHQLNFLTLEKCSSSAF